jgi:SAM-dependent methyltransferase
MTAQPDRTEQPHATLSRENVPRPAKVASRRVVEETQAQTVSHGWLGFAAQGDGLVAARESLTRWLRVLRATPVSQERWCRLPGALLAWRDAAPFVRLHFLAVATEIGLLQELGRGPATTDQLSVRLAIGDRALFGAFLRLGAVLGELRCRAGRWSLRGWRSKALAVPEADTMRAMVQEAIRYDAAVYAGLDQHLRGASPGDYLRATGAVIARASRLVEPVLAPQLRSLVAERHPRRILDVGCGTGVYLIHAAAAGGPQLAGLGVDLDATVVGLARQRLAHADLTERFDVRHADIRTLQLPAASFDLVLLFQNIYYFAEDQRPDLLRRLYGLLTPNGALMLASLLAGRSLAVAHYDLLFRATEGCGPLPHRQELDRQLRDAGFTTTRWLQLIPFEAFHAVVAER